MAFKISPTPSYTTQVKVVMPGEDGKNITETFKVKFKRNNVEQLKELRESDPEELLKSNILDFSELLDEENNVVEFNAKNLQALLSVPQARAALVNVFWETQIGAKEKN